MHAARLLAFVVLTALPLSAQRPTFIVDAANGPGAQFTDLPTAVAAVPDGAVLLLRPGNYASFSVSGKGLSIVGVGGDPSQVRITGNPLTALTIDNTTAAQPFLIKDLTLETVFYGVNVTLQDCAGAVIWDGVRGDTWFAAIPRFIIERCDNVQLHRCSFDAEPDVYPIGPPRLTATDSRLQISFCNLRGFAGKQGLVLLRSRCEAFASSITGGRDTYMYCPSLGACFGVNGPGGPGVVADHATFIALRTPVAGGGGSNGAGIGIVLNNSSRAVFEGSSAIGGSTGTFTSPAYTLGAGSTYQANSSSIPSTGDILGSQQVGETIDFALDGAPSSLAALLFAVDPTLTLFEPYALGSFLSSTVITVGPLFLSSSGSTTWPFKIPSSYPLGETYHWQFATVEPNTNRLWLTSSFPLHVDS